MFPPDTIINLELWHMFKGLVCFGAQRREDDQSLANQSSDLQEAPRTRCGEVFRQRFGAHLLVAVRLRRPPPAFATRTKSHAGAILATPDCGSMLSARVDSPRPSRIPDYTGTTLGNMLIPEVGSFSIRASRWRPMAHPLLACYLLLAHQCQHDVATTAQSTSVCERSDAFSDIGAILG